MNARQLEESESVTDIVTATHGLAAGELEGPASSLLRTFGRMGEDLDAAMKQESAYNQRLALGPAAANHTPTASARLPQIGVPS